ncbi:hypothetical protein [Anaerophilus nitritogenes]|nr:hypothetical protein [Anaerophilus nitritogenes]
MISLFDWTLELLSALLPNWDKFKRIYKMITFVVILVIIITCIWRF